MEAKASGRGKEQQVSQDWRAVEAAQRDWRRHQIKQEDVREETQAIEILENTNLNDNKYEYYSYTPKG